MSFADEVDAALAGLRAVLGTGDPPAPSVPKDLTAAPNWPTWTGTASIAAQDVSKELDRLRTQIHFDQAAAVSLIKHAATITTNARSRMDAVQSGWQQDKNSLAAIAETPLGQIALKQAGQKRLAEGSAVIREAMTEFVSTAQKLQTVSSDLPITPQQAPTPHTVDDLLLPPAAVTPPAEEPHHDENGNPAEQGINLQPTGADIAIAAEGAIAGGTADGVRQATANAARVGTGPGAADPALLKWFEESKMPGFSRIGGIVGVVAAVPAVIADVHEGNSVAEAVTREGASLAAGMASGAATGALIGSIVPGAGTAVGVVAGAVVGAGVSFVTSKAVDAAWEPVSNAVGSAVHSVESIFGFG